MSKRLKVKFAWNHTRYVLSYLLLAFYVIIGGLFLFSQIWSDFIPVGRGIIGIVLILFGVLRFYIAHRRFSKKHVKLQTAHKTIHSSHEKTDH